MPDRIQPPARRHILALLLILLPLYLLLYGGRFHVIDEVSIYALAENLAKRGALDTDQLLWSQWVRAAREVQGAFGLGGHVYSKKGFGSALLPALLVRIALPHRELGLLLSALLTNPLLTALTAVILYLYLLRLGYRRTTGVALALVYGTATLALPYTRTLFGEPVAALGTLFALYALHRDREADDARWALWAGLGFSVSVWARLINTPSLLFLWWYQVRTRPAEARGWRRLLPRDARRGVLFLGTVALLGVGGYALYNTLRFGLPWKTGYQLTRGEFFTTPPWIGFYGLVLSPFRGLIWFSPVLLAALPGFRRFRRTHPPEADALAGIVGIYLLLFSTWWMWWGGFAWGPRFLLPIIPLLVILLAPLWEGERRTGLYVLLGWSLIVQILAVASDFTLSETALELTFGHPERSRAMFDPRWSPIVLQAKHLLMGFWDILWVPMGRAARPVVGSALGGILAGVVLLRVRGRRWGALLGGLGILLTLLALGLGITRASAYTRERPGERDIAAAVATADGISLRPKAWVTLAPFDYEAWMNRNHTRAYVLGMAPHPAPLYPEEERLLERLLDDEGILWLLAARLPPAHPDALAEAVLSRRAFPFFHRWFGDMRLVGYVAPHGDQDPVEVISVGRAFTNGIVLDALRVWGGATVGGTMRVSLLWRAVEDISREETVFLHLLTEDGRFVAGYDAPPQNGYRPTLGWRAGDRVEDRKGLLVPRALTPGPYILEVGMYDPTTGQRVPLREGGTAVRVRVHLHPPVPVLPRGSLGNWGH